MSKKQAKRVRRKKESPTVRTQFLIFTLFGDYVMDRRSEIWTSDLLYFMGLLGVSERAVRSALSRMKRKGWLTSRKHGRRSKYALTRRGQALLREGRRRIFEPVFTEWDGKWHLVVYSLPEKKRRLRHALRTQLSWLGFGSLAPGTWISPRDRRDELHSTFKDLAIEPYVDLFFGVYEGPSSNRELVQRCWDLDELGGQYRHFIEQYQQEYNVCLDQHNGAQHPDPETCFLRRFWLTHDFQRFPLQDPNLPPTLLPPGWIGVTARKMMNNYRQILATYANQFVDCVLDRNGATT